MWQVLPASWTEAVEVQLAILVFCSGNERNPPMRATTIYHHGQDDPQKGVGLPGNSTSVGVPKVAHLKGAYTADIFHCTLGHILLKTDICKPRVAAWLSHPGDRPAAVSFSWPWSQRSQLGQPLPPAPSPCSFSGALSTPKAPWGCSG